MGRNPGWVSALKKLNKTKPTTEEIQTLISMLTKDENDRGVALTTGAALEKAMHEFVQSYIVPDLERDELGSLFGTSGPLDSFSKKIKFAYAFGYIDKNLRDYLECFREIRNAFAHTFAPITFETEAIANACQHLTLGHGRRVLFSGHGDAPRSLFVSSAGAAMVTLVAGRRNAGRPSPDLPITFDAVWSKLQRDAQEALREK